MVKIKVRFRYWPNSTNSVYESLSGLDVRCVRSINDGPYEDTAWPVSKIRNWCVSRGMTYRYPKQLSRDEYEVVFMDAEYAALDAQEEWQNPWAGIC